MNVDRSPLLSVIIPYFQRKPGILGPCVRSILSQTTTQRVHIIITDDESPISATDELAHFESQMSRITVVRRPNGGPGAARNTALDNVPEETTYVALMDSDDAWEPGFLDTALVALERGYDLFFSDSKRYSNSQTRFNYDQDPRNNLNPADHTVVDEARSIYEYQGDFFDFLIRRSNILGPSTTVYRFSVAPNLRFNEKLFNGQDRVFKLGLGQHLGRVAFSPTIYGIEGEGINIFDSASWGSPKSISLLSSYIEMSKHILREIQMNDSQKNFVRKQLSDSRYAFVANLLHRFIRRDPINFEVVRRTFGADPMTMALLAPNIAKAAFKKMSAKISR